MATVYIICEGKTEAVFVKNVLAPVLATKGLFVHPVQIGRLWRGGNVTYSRLQTSIRDNLRGHRSTYCSTFIAYYGLPPEFPGANESATRQSLANKAETLCSALDSALSSTIESEPMQRFIPYFQMHEFEALMFSDPATFADAIGRPDLRKEFAKIRKQFETPEHIDNSPVTAPAKRILALCPEYEKPLMGETAASAIGLPRIRQECPLFNAWLTKLENLPVLPA